MKLPPQLNVKDLEKIRQELETFQNILESSIEKEPELATFANYLREIIGVIREEIDSVKQAKTIPMRKEISIVAHLSLLYEIMESMADEDEGDFEEEDAELEFDMEDA